MTAAMPEFPHGADWSSGAVARLALPGPAGPIEAAIEAPDGGTPQLPVIAVFCHPLSTEGGSMGNKVVTMGARALRELGVTTVRFNFRGVGASAGEFDDGEGESADLHAVVDWVRTQRPDHTLWLAGFSFGAYVSIRCAADLQPALLISIAPPAGRSWDFDAMPLYTGPWLVVQGEADEIVAPEDVYRWLDRIGELRQTPTLVRVPDTSHFFHGRLMDLRTVLRDGVAPHLPAAPASAHG